MGLKKKNDRSIEYGHMVANARRDLGLTQAALSKRAKVTAKTISSEENGWETPASKDAIEAALRARRDELGLNGGEWLPGWSDTELDRQELRRRRRSVGGQS